MDLWDKGLPEDAIAAQLGFTVGRVSQTIKNYAEGSVDRWHLNVRPASDRLLQAIRRAHPEMAAA